MNIEVEVPRSELQGFDFGVNSWGFTRQRYFLDFYTFICCSRFKTNSTSFNLCGKSGCVKDS